MLLIGFGHRARQGKNTAALAALNSSPLDMQIRLYAFADALRSEVRTACARMGSQYELIEQWKAAGIVPDWVTCDEPKPRSLLQWWGTEYRRSKDADYWVKRLDKTLTEHKPEVALITDVRFPNEVDYIHSRGGYVVECVRTGDPDFAVHPHWSETALDGYKNWDYCISADTVDACRNQAVVIFAQLGGLDAR